MTAKAKVQNYSAEQVALMVDTYTANPCKETVAAIAESLGKSIRSVVAKLSREGVYKKAEYVAKDGSAVESKADLVALIAAKMGVPADDVGTLESATKATLKLVLAALPDAVEK